MSRRVIFILVCLLVASNLAMMAADTFIQNDVTPYGIISFEFIGSVSQARVAFEAWGSMGKSAVGFSLGIDFLFLLLYSILVCNFLFLTSATLSRHGALFAQVTRVMAYVFPIAGLCDAIENLGLLNLLFGSQNSVWPLIAYYCAIVKFSLIAVSLSTLLLGRVYLAINR